MLTSIIIFLISSSLPWLSRNEKQIRAGAIFTTLFGFAFALSAALPVLFSREKSWSNDWLQMDSFSALMVVLIGFVSLAGVLVSSRYLSHEHKDSLVSLAQLKTYFSLISLFIASMLITVTINNAILIWIALEATTLSSTFLIGIYKKKTSIEAAWKYIIFCSTGITIGLVGILLIVYSAGQTAENLNVFNLKSLSDIAKLLSPEMIKWAFVFLFVGFGAKVGFAPMHTWLPDAHSKAPSPISAMFSGVLLNVALYVILKFKFIVDGTLGDSAWTNKFFLIFGIMSVVLSAFALIIQDNYKRMLAYSSIEHMGLIAIAISFSTIGLAAAVIHMIGHTITKSMLFFGAGEFLLRFKTTKINKINGAMESMPYSGTLFLLGILSIIAAPPSILFASEYILFTSIFASHPILALTLLLILSLIAFTMLKLTIELLYRKGDDEKIEKEKWNITHTVMAIELGLIFVLTFTLTSQSGIAFITTLTNTMR